MALSGKLVTFTNKGSASESHTKLALETVHGSGGHFEPVYFRHFESAISR